MLCAGISGASSAQLKSDNSEADHRAIREFAEPMTPWLLNSDEGLAIIGAALESRHTDSNADCSTLVHAIYERAGFAYSYANSSELYAGIKAFRQVKRPQPGDLVVWRGHVGIVISPVQHSFFSAMRSGRGVEFYDSPYWKARGQPRFFRYLRAAPPALLSASTRSANLRHRSSISTESRDPVPADEDFAPASGVSSTGHAASTSMPERDGDEPASGTGEPARVAPSGAGRENPPAPLPEIEGPPAASFHKSESQTTNDGQRAMDRNKQTPASQKLQSLREGVWEKNAAKPSAGIPFDSVVTPAQPYESRLPQGFGASNIAAKAAHANTKPPSAGGPLINESRPEPLHWEISRYVPRPPWSSGGGRTSEFSVPHPPARGVRHASQSSAY